MNNKTLEDIAQFFDVKFPEPHYYIKKGRDLYVIKGYKYREDAPIIDDGSIVGVKNSCLNFFPFKMGEKEVSPLQWLYKDYIEWLPGNTTFGSNSELEKELRRYFSNSFVRWLMKKYPEIEVHDNRGRKVGLPKKHVIIG